MEDIRRGDGVTLAVDVAARAALAGMPLEALERLIAEPAPIAPA